MLQRYLSWFGLRSRAFPHHRPAGPFGPLSIGEVFQRENHGPGNRLLEARGRQDAPLGRFLLLVADRRRGNTRLIQEALNL